MTHRTCLLTRVNGFLFSGPSTANCLTYSDSAPRSTVADPDTRQTWFFWLYDVEGSWIQVGVCIAALSQTLIHSRSLTRAILDDRL